MSTTLTKTAITDAAIEQTTTAFRRLSAELDALATDPDALLARLGELAQDLRFEHIDLDTTWRLGCLLRAVAAAEALPVAIDIQFGPQRVFHAALPGASADNDGWAARKGAVAARFNDSSLAVGVLFDRDHGGFDTAARLPVADYAAHGGALPLQLPSGIGVGVAAVSGLPSIHDHALVAAAIATIV
ncbi:MAG: heme-binding protein [Bifidobacteriaceae bacterium]|jgi:uncharacterized protein (UPF0303 family)|nr:heme-binding protein [Bifidobacteriaceae bacterium]